MRVTKDFLKKFGIKGIKQMSKRIKIDQGTPEWHAFRLKHIGASEAPYIMEQSPWKSPYQLWQEKLELVARPVPNERMNRGTQLEGLARIACSLDTGIVFEPAVLVHDEIKYMSASLDGLSPCGRYALEIKCPGDVDHGKALARMIPEKYMAQLQHQMEVCQLDKMLYYSFDGENGVAIEVFRDDKFIKELIRKEAEFWECIQSMIAPAMTEKDYTTIETEEWKKIASEWLSTKEKLKDIESKEKELKDQLILLSGRNNCIGAGIKTSKIVRKGSIDYSAITELSKIDLNLYRKKPTEYWSIREE